jgi:hypothetical protein
MNAPPLLNDSIRLAKYLFCLDAVLGFFSIGTAALYGAANAPDDPWGAFFLLFIPLCGLWALFCYGAYRGLTRRDALTRVVFWISVIGHFPAFPIGTAISGAGIWLWRRVSPQPAAVSRDA